MIPDAVKGPWRKLLEAQEQRRREGALLEERIDELMGRPPRAPYIGPRKTLGLTWFEWNVLRVVFFWSAGCLAVGTAIGRALCLR